MMCFLKLSLMWTKLNKELAWYKNINLEIESRFQFFWTYYYRIDIPISLKQFPFSLPTFGSNLYQ